MELLEGILARRSCKSYFPDPIPEKDVETVVRAGLAAASGRNLQAPVILVLTDPKVRNAYSALNSRYDFAHRPDPFYSAPVILAVLTDKSVSTGVYDASLVLGNMMLAAEALGLGSCWIHRAKECFEDEEGKKILRRAGLDPDAYEGVGNLALGKAKIQPEGALPRREGRVFWIK